MLVLFPIFWLFELPIQTLLEFKVRNFQRRHAARCYSRFFEFCSLCYIRWIVRTFTPEYSSAVFFSRFAATSMYNFRRFKYGSGNFGSFQPAKIVNSVDSFRGYWVHASSFDEDIPATAIFFIPGNLAGYASSYNYLEFISIMLGELQGEGIENPICFVLDVDYNGPDSYLNVMNQIKCAYKYFLEAYPLASTSIVGSGIGGTLACTFLLDLVKPIIPKLEQLDDLSSDSSDSSLSKILADSDDDTEPQGFGHTISEVGKDITEELKYLDLDKQGSYYEDIDPETGRPRVNRVGATTNPNKTDSNSVSAPDSTSASSKPSDSSNLTSPSKPDDPAIPSGDSEYHASLDNGNGNSEVDRSPSKGSDGENKFPLAVTSNESNFNHEDPRYEDTNNPSASNSMKTGDYQSFNPVNSIDIRYDTISGSLEAGDSRNDNDPDFIHSARNGNCITTPTNSVRSDDSGIITSNLNRNEFNTNNDRNLELLRSGDSNPGSTGEDSRSTKSISEGVSHDMPSSENIDSDGTGFNSCRRFIVGNEVSDPNSKLALENGEEVPNYAGLVNSGDANSSSATKNETKNSSAATETDDAQSGPTVINRDELPNVNSFIDNRGADSDIGNAAKNESSANSDVSKKIRGRNGVPTHSSMKKTNPNSPSTATPNKIGVPQSGSDNGCEVERIDSCSPLVNQHPPSKADDTSDEYYHYAEESSADLFLQYLLDLELEELHEDLRYNREEEIDLDLKVLKKLRYDMAMATMQKRNHEASPSTKSPPDQSVDMHEDLVGEDSVCDVPSQISLVETSIYRSTQITVDEVPPSDQVDSPRSLAAHPDQGYVDHPVDGHLLTESSNDPELANDQSSLSSIDRPSTVDLRSNQQSTSFLPSLSSIQHPFADSGNSPDVRPDFNLPDNSGHLEFDPSESKNVTSNILPKQVTFQSAKPSRNLQRKITHHHLHKKPPGKDLGSVVCKSELPPNGIPADASSPKPRQPQSRSSILDRCTSKATNEFSVRSLAVPDPETESAKSHTTSLNPDGSISSDEEKRVDATPLRKPDSLILISPFSSVKMEVENKFPDILTQKALDLLAERLVRENQETEVWASPVSVVDGAWWDAALPERGCVAMYGTSETISDEVLKLVASMQTATRPRTITNPCGNQLHAWPITNAYISHNARMQLMGPNKVAGNIAKLLGIEAYCRKPTPHSD